VKDLRKQRNAPVAMMLEGNVSHGPVDPTATWEFIVEFCKAAMRIRLGKDSELRPVVIEKGWIGGLYDRRHWWTTTVACRSNEDFSGNRSTANWLPDKKFAKFGKPTA